MVGLQNYWVIQGNFLAPETFVCVTAGQVRENHAFMIFQP
jgi:hypothetical protein